MFQILVVEDDEHSAKLMGAVLSRAGYEVHMASNGARALELLETQRADLIVLDVMMPIVDGYEFASLLRAGGVTIPILMVTAKGLPADKREGFLAGTDDYMVKPVDEEEMLLRIRALLRRARIANERRLQIGGVVLDHDSLAVTRGGETQTLPQKEFKLLYLLLSYPNRVFTRLQLMDEVWGVDSETVDTTVNVHVARLRRRLGGWPEFEIVSIRGVGYKAVVHDA